MATATELGVRIAYRVHDKDQAEIDAAGYLAFLNDAVFDLIAHGWLQPIDEDVSLTIVASTYEYSVPADFAYVAELREESDTSPSTYDIVVPDMEWRIGMLATATPKFVLNSFLWHPRVGKKFKVIGQKRPTVYTGSDTVRGGEEAFLIERGVAYAGAYLGEGTSEYAQRRARQSEIALQTSEAMTAFHPMEFRVFPSSRHVPGR